MRVAEFRSDDKGCQYAQSSLNLWRMPTVAEQLRSARVASNLTVDQVAEVTKMRTDHVRALEEGQYKAFPAPVYIRGSIRTYATLLKLDVPAIMQALEAELRHDNISDEALPHPTRSYTLLDTLTLQLSKLDWRKGLVVLLIVLIVAVAIVGYALRRSGGGSDPLKNLEPGVYRPTNDLAPTLPLPSTTPPRKR